jgi:peptidoglycan/LPS O-acetylase OafA/YrhL
MSLLIALLVICAATASFMWRFRRRLERRAGPWIAATAGETLSAGQVQRSVSHAQNAGLPKFQTAVPRALAKDVASSRVAALDLLRLVAVLMVVFYHYGFWGPTAEGISQVALPRIAGFAQYGFLGVPIFFVISGFVIAYTAEGRTALEFGIARFSRIYPTFVFCMSVTFLAVLALGKPYFEVTGLQWFANLFIVAPALGQSYVDTSYWSLVIEVIFYAWIALFMFVGLFPRRLDAIILIWLAITLAIALTPDGSGIRKLFIADDSGFFASGLLIYEYYRGRRDMMLFSLLALSVGTAALQAVHKLQTLGIHTGSSFDPRIVVAICLVSIGTIFLATRIRRVPLPAGLILALGGLTYPFYLLHMQMGYVFYMAAPGNAEWEIPVVVMAIGILSWAIWRFVERPAQRWTRGVLTDGASHLAKKPARPQS